MRPQCGATAIHQPDFKGIKVKRTNGDGRFGGRFAGVCLHLEPHPIGFGLIASEDIDFVKQKYLCASEHKNPTSGQHESPNRLLHGI